VAAPGGRGARERAVKWFERTAIAAVVIAAAVLAVLGYVSLRQWQLSAELLFREQARDMAAMAAQRVEMSVLKAEEECLGSLQVLLLDPDFRPEMVDAWKAGARLVGQVSLVDGEGRPVNLLPSGAGDPALAGLLAEIPRSFWERGGRRHLMVGDEVVLAAVLRSTRGPLLVVLRRNEEALRHEVLPAALAGAEGPSVLAVIDRADRPVYSPRPLDRAERVLAVPFGEALPTWRMASYQPAGLSPRDAVGRQAMLFTAAFACLLIVIVLGLGATYRLVRRDSEIARLKADFVANVSHDLKTPVSLIRMFAETLEMDRVRDEATRREYYGVITRESERLTRLINNVLDFSRIESGRQRYDMRPGEIGPIVHEVLDSFRYPLVQQGFKLNVDIEPALPAVRMDEAALGQALANLVDNAIKYSDDRRAIRVTARHQGGEVVVAVADDGIGIVPAELDRIFNKFYRAGRSETQGRRGSGLGLTLVKHVAEAHGGRVTVESRAGEGSRFALHLPVAEGSAGP
jgi:signal transduction histidine kinase